jgi:acyl carrier protein
MSVRSIISEQMAQVAREHNKVLAPLRDDLELAESGLDSLSLAVLVARLDEALGFDPFQADSDAIIPVTFGDFVKVYENSAG